MIRRRLPRRPQDSKKGELFKAVISFVPLVPRQLLHAWQITWELRLAIYTKMMDTISVRLAPRHPIAADRLKTLLRLISSRETIEHKTRRKTPR